MPIRNLNASLDEMVEDLTRRHAKYLKNIKHSQLERLITRVKAESRIPPSFALNFASSQSSKSELPPSKPLPTTTAPPVSIPQASPSAPIIPVTPPRSLVTPPPYVPPPRVVSFASADSEDDGRSDDEIEESEKHTRGGPVPHVDGRINLNKLGDEDLAKVKEAMNEQFERNRVGKDDPEFQYDVKKSFGPPIEDNDWDEESDDGSILEPVSRPQQPASAAASTANAIPDHIPPAQQPLPAPTIQPASSLTAPRALPPMSSTPHTLAPLNPLANPPAPSKSPENDNKPTPRDRLFQATRLEDARDDSRGSADLGSILDLMSDDEDAVPLSSRSVKGSTSDLNRNLSGIPRSTSGLPHGNEGGKKDELSISEEEEHGVGSEVEDASYGSSDSDAEKEDGARSAPFGGKIEAKPALHAANTVPVVLKSDEGDADMQKLRTTITPMVSPATPTPVSTTILSPSSPAKPDELQQPHNEPPQSAHPAAQKPPATALRPGDDDIIDEDIDEEIIAELDGSQKDEEEDDDDFFRLPPKQSIHEPPSPTASQQAQTQVTESASLKQPTDMLASPPREASTAASTHLKAASPEPPQSKIATAEAPQAKVVSAEPVSLSRSSLLGALPPLSGMPKALPPLSAAGQLAAASHPVDKPTSHPNPAPPKGSLTGTRTFGDLESPSASQSDRSNDDGKDLFSDDDDVGSLLGSDGDDGGEYMPSSGLTTHARLAKDDNKALKPPTSLTHPTHPPAVSPTSPLSSSSKAAISPLPSSKAGPEQDDYSEDFGAGDTASDVSGGAGKGREFDDEDIVFSDDGFSVDAGSDGGF
ncbi:Centrosomal protein of 19 kDa [Rhizophlyctis rosea]|nr:Centrosomal protein of 19 kDa [Rhizophlyctis rosea]